MRRTGATLLTVIAAATQLSLLPAKGPSPHEEIPVQQYQDSLVTAVQRAFENASYKGANMGERQRGYPLVGFTGSEEGPRYQVTVSGHYTFGTHVEGSASIRGNGVELSISRDTDPACWVGKNEVRDGNGHTYPICDGIAQGADARTNALLAELLRAEKRILIQARNADYFTVLPETPRPTHEHRELPIADDVFE